MKREETDRNEQIGKKRAAENVRKTKFVLSSF